MNNNSKKRKIFDGKYEILGIVGKGQSSVVYHARSIDKNVDVAIKVLVDKQQELNNRELLRKESLSLVSCRHSNVVKLEDFQVLDSICYLVMEYANKRDIVNALNGEVLDYKLGENFLIQILQGLDFIHKIGFIHRDICPENILVFDNDVVKLGDFGLGMVVHEVSDVSQLKSGIVKKDFVAPEYFNDNDITFSSDIYSLGATFFYLFTHSKSLNTDLIKNKKLAFCLKKMIAVSPEERFKSASDVLEFLSAKNPISVEASRRLTKDHLEDIALLEDDFEKFHNVIKNDNVESIKEYKDEFESSNSRELNTRETLDLDDESVQNAFAFNSRKSSSEREITKMTLKEINREKLQELENNKNNGNQVSRVRENDIQNVDRKINVDTKPQGDDNVYQFVYEKKGKGKNFFLILLFFLSVLLLLFSLGVFDAGMFGRDENLVKSVEEDTANNILVADVKLTFPNLPDGVYKGNFSGFVFETMPFIISVKDNNVFFKINEMGFEPVIFDNSKNIETMEVRFNGFIFVLKSNYISKNNIKGNVVNKVTGEKGSWSLKLVEK